ncbi:translation initiation factor IF-2 [Levilactobacillus hammesii]|uniref:Translation initiation factor IF-2 n=1 Tax=Levilactobacillus hammesii DSM 16381 TaxID=1423753 RepID=A0A0R1UWV7_9LACO|nr:translation initiation factor IF-2 [Levilactobacillus hammesii]KRL97639.1 translation initiation factor 2 [Levilactobacillus hammesii DSM 16381]
MGKKRIYELAKEINVSSKQIIAKAEAKGFPVKNHMSTLGENEERQLREAFSKSAAGKTSHNAQPAKRPAMQAARPASQKSDHPKTSHKPATQNSGNGSSHATANQGGNKPTSNHGNHTTNGNGQSTNQRSNNSGNRNQQRSTSNNNKNNNGQSGSQHTEQHRSGTGRFGGSLNNNTNNSNGRRGSSNGSSRGGRNNRNNRNNRRRNNNNNNRYKKNQRIKDTNQHKGAPERKNKALPEVLVYTDGMNAQDLAKILHRSSAEIVKKLFMLGVMVNQNQSLDKDTIEILADDYGIQAQEKVQVDVTDIDKFFDAEMANTDHQETRAPVVTIMGHVDHGKTTLLDHLRHSHITEGEAGGITQAIGAYQVHYNDKSITFLDTPGHAAFTEMRARGAEITDITVLVVAADDGVMPQTIEAIHHAKAAGTPIIVAVNKIDKPGANPNHVMEQLTEYELIPEDWGGDTIFVEISAKFGKNIDELLDMILLQSEVLELKANPEQNGVGSVIEARLDQGRGSVATLLVQQGTLHVGDPIVVGNTFGKVRTMTNERGRRIKDAKPSTPVEITGLNDVPEAGDRFVVFDDEKTARSAGEERAKEALVQERKNTSHVTLDNLFDSLKEGEMKEVDVIIKADVQGSVEALAGSLKKIDVSGVRVNIIHSAVGAINESDVTLAEASDAIIIGFNVRPTPQARMQADSDKVDIRLHNVIYNAIDEIETAMKGMLEPTYEEQVTGEIEVKDIFHASKVGTIVGGMVTEGYITADADVRLIRDGVVIYEGKLGSLKRFKDDVKQVKMGYELGLTIENYNDIKVDDVIEAYVMKEVPVK